MKSIYFDHKHSPAIVISDEAYERILKIVDENKVCNKCGKLYAESNPQVARNLCKECFLKAETHYPLVFLGPLSMNKDTYKFIDSKGYIYLSSATSENKAERSIIETLRHWHFTVPGSYEVDEKTRPLYDIYWTSIHGDFREQTVIVAEYVEEYGNPIRKQFLVHKDGGYRELNRRKGDIKKLFVEARKQAEATKDARGEYHIDGWTTYQLYDSYLYTLVAKIANEEHTLSSGLEM